MTLVSRKLERRYPRLIAVSSARRAAIAREGSEVIETTPETFARFVQAESRKYLVLLRVIGYRPE